MAPIADATRERYRAVIRNEVAGLNPLAGGMMYADHLRDRLVAATTRGNPSQRADATEALAMMDEAAADPNENSLVVQLVNLLQNGLIADGSAPRG